MIQPSSKAEMNTRPSTAGLGNRFLAIGFACAVVFGCDTGSRGDVQNEESIEEEDAGGGSRGDVQNEESIKEEDAGAEIETDGSVEATNVKETPEYTTALVVTSNRQEGAYSTISIDDHSVEKDIASIHSDAVCRFDSDTRTLFIILRRGSDAIDVLNPDTFEIEKEYSAEPSTNPQDIAVVSLDRAYISRLASTDVLIVEPLTGTQIGTVDFSEYADDDGWPEVNGMNQMNDKVYALVSRIDRNHNWAPAGKSYLVIIDAESGEIEDDFELTGTKPYESLIYSVVLEKFIISESGDFSDLKNAGVELFDPDEQTLSGFIVTEEELEGNVVKTLIVSETKAYTLLAVEAEEGNDTHIVSFNPVTGKKIKTVMKADGWIYGDMVLTPDLKELWITDRTKEDPGIRIIDTETDEEKTDEPIDVGLPPSDICFTF